ncbi:hypothetical protein PPYR_04455 [Photinus pyralis]|uniref:N-acetyltransferase domain-containing protein n=1 Tax=Photinus pyralis TaxID=7054 RepID=A0A1Y1LF76_PHOPY|nr:diamine acetyltransferase 2-like [Photinus pyralis]KAB0802269.1 hypothetical protein PPYR_04455 [Photinus pyralis]
MSNSVIIRDGKKEDMHQICKLIKELATYENCESMDECKMTPERLIKDGFDTANPIFKSFVADRNNQVIGYAIYFTSYSSWVGESIFLEDLYVDPQYRGEGIGEKLFKCVAKVAQQNDGKRMDWHCLAWNPSLKFYKKMGARNITESESWNYLRLDGSDLDKLCE